MNTRRHRPQSSPAAPMLHDSHLFPSYRRLAPTCANPFVDVKVADFVCLPQGRRQSERFSLGPVDVTVRPPSYDLAVNNNHANDNRDDIKNDKNDPLFKMSPQKVFLIDDTCHVNRLMSIVQQQQDQEQQYMEDGQSEIVQDADIDEQVPSLSIRTETDSSVHAVDEMIQGMQLNNSNIQNSVKDIASSQLASIFYDSYSPDSFSQIWDEEIEQDDGASTVSNLSLDSSVASSLADVFSVSSFSEDEQRQQLQQEEQEMICKKDIKKNINTYVAVKDLNEKRRAGLSSLLQRNTPAPVKYTFRPLHKVISSEKKKKENEKDLQLNEMKRKSSSTSMKEPATLSAVKNVVEKINPKTAVQVTGAIPLNSVGIFKRMSNKRMSDESNDSSKTEYYQDEYTKFIEKGYGNGRIKSCPISRRMITDAWVFGSNTRMTERSYSPLSISTSDEYYNPTIGKKDSR